MKLIISAIPSELAVLREALEPLPQPGYAWAEPQGLALATVGVGWMAAGQGLERLLTSLPETREVWFVGTAGAYPYSGVEVGQSCLVKEVKLLDGACEMGLARYPSLMKDQVCHASPPQWGLPQVSVACLLGLTLDVELARRIEERQNCLLENMELFSLAQACKNKNISWNACLGVTNEVGPQGHDQWKRNREEIEKQNGLILLKKLA